VAEKGADVLEEAVACVTSANPAPKLKSRSVVRPPGPKGSPVLGVFSDFRRNPPDYLLKVAREYGDLAYFKMGPQHMYLINRPDWIQDVLVTHAGKFRKSRILQRAKILLGEGLLTADGQDHLRKRRLVQPAFHRQRLVSYAATMVECAARMSDQWQTLAASPGSLVLLDEQMMRLTLAIVGKTLFSADVEQSASEVGKAMTDILGLFDMMLIPYSQVLQKLPIPSTRRFERAKKVLDSTIYGIIQQRRADRVDRGDLLSMLLLAEEEGSGLNDLQVRDEALTLFLAGHETTANALTWSWFLLAQHPEVEARFHAEIDEVLGDRQPTFDDFPRLSYTEQIVAEAMRLYPPAWSLGRLAMQDHQVGDYEMPAGSICLLSPFVMHRSPQYFPDPETFNPDRWTPEFRDTRPKFAYFPFGGGARVCIGERFAWMESVLVLATLGRRWRLKYAGEQHPGYRAQITLRPKDRMRMTLSAR
jgi:cytochrome P450